MASENVPQETSPAPSTQTHPAWSPTDLQHRLGRWARTLLVVGAVFQVVTLLLPWEHAVIPSDYTAYTVTVSTFITSVPFTEVLFAGRCIPLDVTSCPHLALAGIFWDVFWRGALLLIGLLLVLAFCLARHVALRWSFAVLFGVWLLYTTGLALAFATTASAIDSGAAANPAVAYPTHSAWWWDVFQVAVTQFGTIGNRVTPAWGYWLYLAALGLCWVALGLAIAALLRSRSASAAGAEYDDGSARARRAPLAALLVTAGALIWTISVAALPLVVADCSRPLVPLTPTEVHLLCADDARVYPLQVSVLNYVGLDAGSAQPPSLAELRMPGPALLGVLTYFRDFALLVLTVVATPLAVVAVWRRRAERGTAAWLSAWAALGLVGTGFLFRGLAVLLAPNPPPVVRPAFAEGIGPGAVLAPVGIVVLVAGVVLYWLQLRRDGLRPAPAARAV